MQSSIHDDSGLFDTMLDLYRFFSGPLCAALFLGLSFVMLLIVGTIRLAPENLDAARPVMREMVEASRAELGCLHYSYAQDLFDPGLIHVKELWRDAAALDRHFTSPHIERWRATWPMLGIGERNLRSYTVDEGRET